MVNLNTEQSWQEMVRRDLKNIRASSGKRIPPMPCTRRCSYRTSHHRRAGVVAPGALETWPLLYRGPGGAIAGRDLLAQSRELLKQMKPAEAAASRCMELSDGLLL